MNRSLRWIVPLLFVFILSCTPLELQNAYAEMRSCAADADCVCGGTVLATGDCFLGNRNWASGKVDFSKGCPDYCGGEAGDLVVKCINNQCSQVAQEQASKPPAVSTGECTTNTDCFVGGCSGQLCTPAADAGGPVFSTCEFKEEYACVKQSTCGCFEGGCGWEQNSVYVKCMSDAGAQP